MCAGDQTYTVERLFGQEFFPDQAQNLHLTLCPFDPAPTRVSKANIFNIKVTGGLSVHFFLSDLR